jgi:hypothetical protein
METTQVEDRSDNPTVNDLLQYATIDLMDVRERRFNGRTFRREKSETLYIVSPVEVLLLFSVQQAMAALSALRFLTERSESGIGPQTVGSLSDSRPGYAKVLRLVEAMEQVALYDLELDRTG